MNSIQFLAATVDNALGSVPEPQKKDLLDCSIRIEQYDEHTESNSTTPSIWRKIAIALVSVPHLLFIKPISYFVLLFTYPFKLVMSTLFPSSDKLGLVNEAESVQFAQNTSESPNSIATINEDDIEFSVQQNYVDDDQLKSPKSGKKKPRKRDFDPHVKQQTRFLFPKLLINSRFDISNPPPNFAKKTLVLDLDETLIHSLSHYSSSFVNKSKGRQIEIKIANQMATLYYIYKRPHVDEFLNTVKHWFNLVCFTASIKEYADPVIDYLESSVREPGQDNLFQMRLYRDHCTWKENVGYVKNLNLCGQQDMSKLFIIDNSPVSYSKNKNNGVMIEGWINDPHDLELMNLLPLLNALRYCSDVRDILRLKRGELAF